MAILIFSVVVLERILLVKTYYRKKNKIFLMGPEKFNAYTQYLIQFFLTEYISAENTNLKPKFPVCIYSYPERATSDSKRRVEDLRRRGGYNLISGRCSGFHSLGSLCFVCFG